MDVNPVDAPDPDSDVTGTAAGGAPPSAVTESGPPERLPLSPPSPASDRDQIIRSKRRNAIANLWVSSLNLLVAVIALFVTWSGFRSVSHQIQQSQATLILETSEKIYARMHDIHTLFIEHPTLRPYFYGGLENTAPVTPEEAIRHQRVAQAAEMLCDFFHQALIQIDAVPLEDRRYRAESYRDLHDGWACYMKDVWKLSPALRAHYDANRSWYTSNTLAMRVFGAAEQERQGLLPVPAECATTASPAPPAPSSR